MRVAERRNRRGEWNGHGSRNAARQSLCADGATSYTHDALVYFVLSDAPAVCGDLVANAVKASSCALLFYLPDVTVGMTYGGPSVRFAQFDATCNSLAGESGSGTVTITAASATSVSGTFAFTLNSDSVSGSFVAPNCPGAPGAGAQVCR